MIEPYIIGETAYHHEGNFEFLLQMAEDIAGMNLNAVKFHLLLNVEDYMQKSHPLVEATRKFSFSVSQWRSLFHQAGGYGLDIIALCDDLDSIKFICDDAPSIAAMEIHATSINDYHMLQASLLFPGRIILGVGGSTVDEIDYAVSLLRRGGKKDLCLMYGFQVYPTQPGLLNLSRMLKLQQLFDLPVGYADHTGYDDQYNAALSALAAAQGIHILEKHYSPEPGVKRTDYHAAVGKETFAQIKSLMKLYLEAYGSGALELSPQEQQYGLTGPMKKALVARKKIEKGRQLSVDNLCFKRTQQESPLRQMDFPHLLGLTAIRNIEEDEMIDYSMVEYRKKPYTYADLTGGMKQL